MKNSFESVKNTERITPQSESLTQVSKFLFPNIESKKGKIALEQGIGVIQHTFSQFTDEMIAECEERYLASEQDREYTSKISLDDNLLESYLWLRGSGFTDTELKEMSLSARSGEVPSLILDRIMFEQSGVNEWLCDSSEKIEQVNRSVEELLICYGVESGNDDSAPVVGIGKYQGMVLASTDSTEAMPLPARGWYLSEMNTVYLKMIGQGQEVLSNRDMHLLTHERIHSISARNLPDEYKIMHAGTTPGFQSGFSRVKGDSHLDFHHLNEGVTEFFARKVSEKNGLDVGKNGFYEEEIDSLRSLLKYLFKDVSEEETTSLLLNQYCTTGGTDALQQIIKERVGVYGPELVELLFLRPIDLETFLQAAVEGATDKKVEIDVRLLGSLDPKEVMLHQPSIVCVTHVRDNESGEYKKVYV